MAKIQILQVSSSLVKIRSIPDFKHLKNLGYESQVRTSNKKSKIAELITKNILAAEESAKFVKTRQNPQHP